MPTNPNKLSQFWQELKRRKVVRVITIYAAAAFVILELTDIVAPSLGLPGWTLNFIIILLCVGFIITVIVSWIYDIHPEGGIVKTEPAHKVKSENIPVPTNSWKIATYVSVVIILCLLTLNIVGSNNRVKIDESLAKSIAVLPFQNFSEDSDQEFMCLGLTDEIINHLYKIESFDKVVSLTSVLNYRDPKRNISEIANELGVNYILEGVYKKIGDQLSVSAQLIEPRKDRHIWQNDYDQPYEEIIAIQTDIALQIADHLKAFFTVSEAEIIQNIPTNNLEAYELEQQAEYILQTQGLSELSQVIDLVNKVIELDPNYADAYAWAGIFTLLKGVYAGGSEMQSVIWDALLFFDKALELNRNIAGAHYGLGLINEWVKWDYIKAEKEYIETIDLEPNNLERYNLIVEFFIKMHRLEDALLFIKKINEGSSREYGGIIRTHILSGNKKEAYHSIKACQEAIGEESHRMVGEYFLWMNENDSARVYLELALQKKDPEIFVPRYQAYLALAYEKTNSHEKARKIINQLIEKSDSTTAGSPEYFTGWYYSWTGEIDSAFYWLEKAYNNRSPEMPWLKVDPAFNNLKEDDRYWDLYERTGHKAYDDYLASKKQ